ncbi:phosphatidylglycerophosphate synthase, putative [Babesia bigemina]|uniref:CDP-diacylglycerol--glycerol-3-phosphate 3-phosphatidyltransferase n=1 Tax=Babesia bigemina TaxID=5866 RepID=A0A061D705_BABBI|nr:phosphatidylglycerophosphate synthase, putative [Babesia bigemina]CDR94709.1 phosphatidylglycerophosphate synthase, putative [Babesia bigemina]|eukprot:XP_012766895.1 phosphatidylglycerophosphate synthase, putative [Babesia bigemina]
MADDTYLVCSVPPENVRFLASPDEFYRTLCKGYESAQKRVVLACLYVGCGELEEQLIRSIVTAKQRNDDLTVDVLVDKTRTSRVGSSGKIVSPLTQLQPYLAPGHQTKVSLLHNPLLGRLCSKVIKSPYCEAFGTMHIKVFIADDQCIITGANAGRDYFCDRYDRYMVVRDPLFADLMHTIVRTFQTASFELTENLTVEWHSDFVNPLEDNLLYRKQLYIRTAHMVNKCREILEKNRFHGHVDANGDVQPHPADCYTSNRSYRDCSPLSANSSYPEGCCDDEVDLGISDQESQDDPNSPHATWRKRTSSERSSLEGRPDLAAQQRRVTGLRGEDDQAQKSQNTDSSPDQAVRTKIPKTGGAVDAKTNTGSDYISVGRTNKESPHSRGERGRCGLSYILPDGATTDGSAEELETEQNGEKEGEYYCHIKICVQLPFTDPPFMQGATMLENWLLQYTRAGYSALIATAYMNFTERYMEMFKEILEIGKTRGKRHPLQVVTSSPYANSFYRDGSLKRNIALFYSTAATWLFKALRDEEGYPEDIYMEYNRPNHTFHAKGIWVLKDRIPVDVAHRSEEEFDAAVEPPCATVIGSSNYGRRSYGKDLEITFLVETNSPQIRRFMRRELYQMIKYSEYVNMDVVASRIGPHQHLIGHIMKSFL